MGQHAEGKSETATKGGGEDGGGEVESTQPSSARPPESVSGALFLAVVR